MTPVCIVYIGYTATCFLRFVQGLCEVSNASFERVITSLSQPFSFEYPFKNILALYYSRMHLILFLILLGFTQLVSQRPLERKFSSLSPTHLATTPRECYGPCWEVLTRINALALQQKSDLFYSGSPNNMNLGNFKIENISNCFYLLRMTC